VESVEVTEERRRKNQRQRKKKKNLNSSNTMNTTIWEAGIDGGPSPIQ
jgi:hypothetical protein